MDRPASGRITEKVKELCPRRNATEYYNKGLSFLKSSPPVQIHPTCAARLGTDNR